MSDNAANNVKALVKRKCEASGAGGGSRPLPHHSKRARSALEDRIVEMFAAGRDTMRIAGAVKLSEAQVYNILARLA
jgi:DNA-binding CsgD family transcriptional regulator